MKWNQIWVATVLGAAFLWPSGTAKGDAVGNAFTYQGRLTENGSPVTDTCDFEFSLWDGADTPPAVQIGSTQTVSNVAVTDGLFTAPIDFGAGVFEGTERWQKVAVRCPAGSGSFDTLGPRQELTPTPYGIFAVTAETLKVPATLTAGICGDYQIPSNTTVLNVINTATSCRAASRTAAYF